MSASPYLSKHLPGIASGLVAIPAADLGVATINTGLKTITSVTGSLATVHAANEESHAVFDWFGKAGAATDLTIGQARMTVTKGGTNDADAADSAVSVAFTAHGDR